MDMKKFRSRRKVLILISIVIVFTISIVCVHGAVDEVPPVAKFEISNVTPSVNESITFDATGSSDTEGSIATYSWDFGDGSSGSGVSVKHSYTAKDDYKVTLTITDSAGNTDTKKKRVFVGRPDGWTEKTHHKSADADYDLLFPEDSVLRLDIKMSAADYQKIKDNLATLNMQSTQDPIYVPVTVQYNGNTWWNVGFRYKGQSSLFGTRNKNKLPFRLNFDRFEDTYPEIMDQCFYGFKNMTFGSNWNDYSFMKEKVCADIFRAGGVPSARSSFCRIFIDTGSGAKYWGLYTMTEEVSDAMLKAQFEDGSGNCYKPKGTGADWSSPFVQGAFVKETNEDLADFSDVKNAHSALHADRSNAVSWRANLDKYFNTNRFLRWLAINTAVVNWDSYGLMAQNYYLYQDVASGGALVWITWDHNLSLTQQAMMGKPLSLSLDEVTNKWPLIRFILDDPVYKNIYNNELKKALSSCIKPDEIALKVQKYQSMIKPYVVGAEGETSDFTQLSGGETAFNNACNSIISHLKSRQTEINNYLNTVSISCYEFTGYYCGNTVTPSVSSSKYRQQHQ